MKNKPMKPETIARRKEKRKVETAQRRASLEQRLSDKAQEHGPESIWAEMLSDLHAT